MRLSAEWLLFPTIINQFLYYFSESLDLTPPCVGRKRVVIIDKRSVFFPCWFTIDYGRVWDAGEWEKVSCDGRVRERVGQEVVLPWPSGVDQAG